MMITPWLVVPTLSRLFAPLSDFLEGVSLLVLLLLLLVDLFLVFLCVVGSDVHFTLALMARFVLTVDPLVVSVGTASLVLVTVAFAFLLADSSLAFRVATVMVFERPRHGYSGSGRYVA